MAESLLFPDREFAAFLFDMDGTVLTSIVAAERVWGAWARKHGLDVEAVLQRIHGRRGDRDRCVASTFPMSMRRPRSWR